MKERSKNGGTKEKEEEEKEEEWIKYLVSKRIKV